MSSPPRRLKDDPDFRWETGCDLADEAFALGGYDLPGMRAQVLAATQPPSAGAPLRAARPWSLSATVGVVLLLLGLGGVAGIGLLAPAEAPVPEAPEVAPTERTPPPRLSGGVDEEEVGTAADGSVPRAETVAPVVPEAAPDEPARPAAAPARAAAPDRPMEPAAPAGEADAPTHDEGGAPVAATDEEAGSPTDAEALVSDLATEVAMYDAATERLGGGDAAGAADAYRAYLEAYPQGRLVVESQLGLLRAQVVLGPSDAVESLAVQLLSDERLGARHDELRRMRADNLVLMGRCDDALAVARDLPSRDAGPIRRACRWKH